MKIIQPLVRSWEKNTSSIFFLAKLYSRFFRRVVEKEIELAEITEKDTILNIGCGAVPFTAYYLALLSGAKVWAVDCDDEAIEKASFFLQHLNGAASRVKLVREEGSSFVPENFTAAVVALQAEPKEEIFHHLIKTAPSGGRLVFRQAKERFKSHYDALPQGVKPLAYVQQNKQTFDLSLLFVK